MVKFRTASGLVDCTAFVRTATGLVQCDETIFFGTAGPVGTGGDVSTIVATISPDTVFGAASRPGSAVVYTNSATVSVVGGKAPYAYAWSTDPAFNVSSIASATTTFRASVASGDTAEADFVCTVTDANGRTAVSNSVHATASNYGKELS